MAQWLLALDESILKDTITVGGVLVRVDAVRAVAGRWQELKSTLGIECTDELKYTMPAHHPTRLKLDAAGITHATRVPLMLDAILASGVTLVSNTLVDERTIRTGKAVDFYVNAFDWILRRFGNHIQYDCPVQDRTDLHMVVVDLPRIQVRST